MREGPWIISTCKRERRKRIEIRASKKHWGSATKRKA